ncbi:putative Fungal-specific transcription factor domain-containing protein [Seiridium unicorne]|uniref:Fungal-specific transcription factor domain-containing protein n=1 Tax=Seiridium unicorne TaxID=138068 RepID=A0ABR2UFI9_9PEZI
MVVVSMGLEHETLGLLIQSAAAIHMSWKELSPRKLAVSIHTSAINSYRRAIQDIGYTGVSDSLLLSTLLLGFTAPWHEICDVGTIHVHGARVLFKHWLAGFLDNGKHESAFILNCFIYWQSMFSFIGNDPAENLIYHMSLDGPIETYYKMLSSQNPRYQTQAMAIDGITLDLFNTIGKAAALCRARQLGIQLPDSQAHVEQIETCLLKWQPPASAHLVDLQDPNTSPKHILHLLDAIRLAALLQLYSSSTSLLKKRMLNYEGCPEISTTAPCFDFANTLHELEQSADKHTICNGQQRFLRALAIHILELISGIPYSSGTCTLQPVPLTMVAAWITQLPEPSPSQSASERTAGSKHDEYIAVEFWRMFIRTRLQNSDDYMGTLLPLRRVQALIEEVWRRNGTDGVQCDWITLITSDEFRTFLA